MKKTVTRLMLGVLASVVCSQPYASAQDAFDDAPATQDSLGGLSADLFDETDETEDTAAPQRIGIAPESVGAGSAEALPMSSVNKLTASNGLYLNQMLKLTGNGQFGGNVVTVRDASLDSLAGVTVTLAQNGRVIAADETNESGQFGFDGVIPGYYVLMATSDTTFACVSVTAIAEQNASHLPNAIELRSVSPISNRLEELVGLQAMQNRTPIFTDLAPPTSDPLMSERQFANSYVVKRDQDGMLVGSVSRAGRSSMSEDLSDISIYVLNGDIQAGAATADPNGNFKIGDLADGCYSFVAIGPSDIAACSFCLQGERMVSNSPSDGTRFVVQAAPGAASLNVVTADLSSVPLTVFGEQVVPEGEMLGDVPPAPVGPQFAGGGGGQIIGGGGGGGAFGEGNLGGLLGLAGLAGIAYAISESDDDDNTILNPPPVVSAIAP
jgi:hypothetical protein